MHDVVDQPVHACLGRNLRRIGAVELPLLPADQTAEGKGEDIIELPVAPRDVEYKGLTLDACTQDEPGQTREHVFRLVPRRVATPENEPASPEVARTMHSILQPTKEEGSLARTARLGEETQ